MLERNLPRHPYDIVGEFIADAHKRLKAWTDVLCFEDPNATTLSVNGDGLEESHQQLFQDLWVKFSKEDYEDRISRFVHRLEINDLANGFLRGKDCIDFGCGHGNFAHALLKCGANSVTGIDFGEHSIEYAVNARDRLGVPQSRISFVQASVYAAPKPDASCDFAIQNGVFHHLEDEDRAYQEVYRVLKPRGFFWVYTDGSGAISHALWDASRRILRSIPHDVIVRHLEYLNIEVGKRYHLGDGLNAVYRHTTYEELVERLATIGFGDFHRMVGGFPTDFDHDVIEADKFGQEKFGSGDLRVLARKL